MIAPTFYRGTSLIRHNPPVRPYGAWGHMVVLEEGGAIYDECGTPVAFTLCIWADQLGEPALGSLPKFERTAYASGHSWCHEWTALSGPLSKLTDLYRSPRMVTREKNWWAKEYGMCNALCCRANSAHIRQSRPEYGLGMRYLQHESSSWGGTKRPPRQIVTAMCSSSEEGSFLRRIDFCITQL